MNTSSGDNLVKLPPLPQAKESALEVEKVIWVWQAWVRNEDMKEANLDAGASSALADKTNPGQVQVTRSRCKREISFKRLWICKELLIHKWKKKEKINFLPFHEKKTANACAHIPMKKRMLDKNMIICSQYLPSDLKCFFGGWGTWKDCSFWLLTIPGGLTIVDQWPSQVSSAHHRACWTMMYCNIKSLYFCPEIYLIVQRFIL